MTKKVNKLQSCHFCCTLFFLNNNCLDFRKRKLPILHVSSTREGNICGLCWLRYLQSSVEGLAHSRCPLTRLVLVSMCQLECIRHSLALIPGNHLSSGSSFQNSLDCLAAPILNLSTHMTETIILSDGFPYLGPWEEEALQETLFKKKVCLNFLWPFLFILRYQNKTTRKSYTKCCTFPLFRAENRAESGIITRLLADRYF